MNLNEYNWLVNDSVTSLERLNYYLPEILWSFNNEQVDLEKSFNEALVGIADGLVEIDNKKFAENPNEDILIKVMDYCNLILSIRDSIRESLIDKNYHRHDRILYNETKNIRANIVDIYYGICKS